MTQDLDISVFRPDRPGIRKVLGDLEAEIMEIIWARPEAQGTTVRNVFEILYDRRRQANDTIAYTTVMNTMARMARKNLLQVAKEEHAYVYSPKYTEEQFISGFVGRILEDLLVNFSGPTLQRAATLPDPQARERARQLLEEIAKRRDASEAAPGAPDARGVAGTQETE
ncbi:MAG TPA: BlaI/MecI/CopY family transcriptional regulator [Chloroflexota bacterium]|nr:BlaI/MecI/CopY family transcriptional regulator [Chloroflexota bacterium]